MKRHRKMEDDCGSVAVEAALSFPFIFILLFSILDISLVFDQVYQGERRVSGELRELVLAGVCLDGGSEDIFFPGIDHYISFDEMRVHSGVGTTDQMGGAMISYFDGDIDTEYLTAATVGDAESIWLVRYAPEIELTCFLCRAWGIFSGTPLTFTVESSSLLSSLGECPEVP